MAEPIKLAVNVRSLIPGEIGGLEVAFRTAMSGLLRHAQDLEVSLLTSPANHPDVGEWAGRVRRTRIRAGATDDELGREIEKADVLWCPFGYLRPASASVPSVVNVPDVLHRRFPEQLGGAGLAERVRELRITAARATRVVVPSRFSLAEWSEAYPEAADRARVVPHAPSAEFEVRDDPQRQAALRERLGVAGPIALYPARPWPHKNHEALLRALRVVLDQGREPATVVFSGFAAAPRLQRRARELGVERWVRHAGWLSRDDLPHLYDAASVVLFPSRYEGFGLPVVEARRRGVPVVAAAIPALREAADGDARFVDPDDVDGWAAALDTVARQPSTGEVARSEAGVGEAMFEILAEAAARPAITPPRRPAVFVVTPSLNQAAYLREAVDSVLSQEGVDLDHAVADGGSTDGSVAVLESYGDRVRWRSGSDGGQAAAIEAAWRATDADIVAWLNSDDVYEPGAVAAAVDHLVAHPETAMVYGEAVYIGAAGRVLRRYPTRSPFRRADLAGECFVCQPTVFLRREVFEAVGGLRTDLECAFDYDLWIRVSRHFRVDHLPRLLARSRLHDGAKTLAMREQVYRETLLVAREHFGSVHIDWVTGFLHHRFQNLAGRLLGAAPRPVRRAVFERLVRRAEAAE